MSTTRTVLMTASLMPPGLSMPESGASSALLLTYLTWIELWSDLRLGALNDQPAPYFQTIVPPPNAFSTWKIGDVVTITFSNLVPADDTAIAALSGTSGSIILHVNGAPGVWMKAKVSFSYESPVLTCTLTQNIDLTNIDPSAYFMQTP